MSEFFKFSIINHINCTEMRRILLLVLHIFGLISSFRKCFECNILGGNSPMVVKKNQTLNGLLPILGPEYEVKLELKINS